MVIVVGFGSTHQEEVPYDILVEENENMNVNSDHENKGNDFLTEIDGYLDGDVLDDWNDFWNENVIGNVDY